MLFLVSFLLLPIVLGRFLKTHPRSLSSSLKIPSPPPYPYAGAALLDSRICAQDQILSMRPSLKMSLPLLQPLSQRHLFPTYLTSPTTHHCTIHPHFSTHPLTPSHRKQQQASLLTLTHSHVFIPLSQQQPLLSKCQVA